ncbi:uncharacterized protein LOC130993806 [Salvia miltiorrhiza]|uniref:uncharacterized protein LOC130993806 n=1 Tax=Salvia miltiorrhiza TaxID=226208 RepID=UPI0025AB9986|nr:uncharacterized protein LOC130993806 [Salvia miltiorrhiza]
MASSSNQVPYSRREQINRVAVEISTYNNITYLSTVVSRLNEIGGFALENTFRHGCFGMMLDWQPGQKCNAALHHIVSRHLKITRDDEDDEICFYINGRNVEFTPRDFALVTGLSFGDDPFDPEAEHDLSRAHTFRQFCRSQPVSVRELADIYFDTVNPVVDTDGGLYLRVAHLLVLHAFVLGVDVRRPVQSWTWKLVDDLPTFSRFPWGSCAYRSLNYRLKHSTIKKDCKKYHFYGPSWALFIWGLEKIPYLGPAIAICNAGVYPRFRRWTFVKTKLDGLQSYFESPENGIWEMVPDEYEAKTSYWLSVAGVNAGIGVRVPEPAVFGHRQPRQRYTGGDHNEDAPEHQPRRRSMRQDTGKRPRGQIVDTSSSSSHHDQSIGGDHPVDSGRRSHSHRAPRPRHEDAPAPSQWSEEDWQRMQHMMRESEERVARTVEDSLFRRIKRYFEDKFDAMRCRCSHSTDVHVPRPAPRSHSDRRREPQPEPDSDPAQPTSSEAPSHHQSPAHESPAREVGQTTGDAMHTPQWQHDPFGGPTSFGHVQTPHMGVHHMPTFEASSSYGGPRYSWAEPGTSSAYPFEPARSSAPILTQDEMHEYWKQFRGGVSEAVSEAVAAVPLSICAPEAPRRSRRERNPSAALRSPYVHSAVPRPVDSQYVDGFDRMMKAGNRGNYRTMSVAESEHPLPWSFWTTMQNTRRDLSSNAVDCYMMTMRSRLMRGDDLIDGVDARTTIVLDTELFKYFDDEFTQLKSAWREIFPAKAEGRFIYSDGVFATWQPHAKKMYMVHGQGVSSTHGDWMNATTLILPIHVCGHYITCRVDLLSGVCDIFDSQLFKTMPQPRFDVIAALYPLQCLLGKMLEVSQWFARTTIVDNPLENLQWRRLKIQYADENEQFQQPDQCSSGVFACMYVERLISGSPSLAWGNGHAADYRRKIGSSIYEFCIPAPK